MHSRDNQDTKDVQDLTTPIPDIVRRGSGIGVLRLAVILMAAVAVQLPALAAERNTISVAADGSAPYKSIQEAIDAASPNAVIRIGPGIYEGHLKITKPLTLEGAGWEKTTVLTRNRTAQMLQQLQSTIMAKMQQAESDEQRREIKEQFEFEYKTKCGRPALLVSDTKDVAIRGLKLTSPGESLEGRSLSVAIIEFSRAEASMSDCVVIATPGDGIRILDGSDVEIRNTLVAAAWSTGIAIAGGDAETSAKIIDCDIRNCHHRCITIGRGADSTVVKGCRISGSAWHGIRYDYISPTISENLIFANARSGIYASGKTAATVKGNVFFGNEMTGMSCWFDNTDTIERNTFTGNKRSGLEILGASLPIVQKNIFSNNPKGIYCGNAASNLETAKSKGGFAVERNSFWNNGQLAVWQHPADNESKSVTENISLDKEAGNIEADPLFKDAEAKNFSLQPDSPARVAGIGASDPIKFPSPWPLQPEEIAIIPDGDTRDSRRWKRQYYDAASAKTIPTDTAAPHTTKSEAPDPAAVKVKDGLHIKAFIDGSDYIKIRGNSIWYEHQRWDLPGKWHDGSRNITHDEPTYLNGVAWRPEWQAKVSKRHQLTGPALPPKANDQIRVAKVKARGNVSIAETPTAENDYTLSILVDDRANAADWYEIVVEWGPSKSQAQNKYALAGKSITSPSVSALAAQESELQSLIDAAKPGDTIVIPKGVHTSPININKPLTLKGKSRADCVLEVTANRPAIFVDTGGKGTVTIEALTIKWQLATSDRCEHPFAVAVKDAKAQVRNCSVLPLGNFKRCPVAIKSFGFSELTIDTCRFEGFEYTVCFGEGTKGAIQNSLVIDPGHQGISLYSGSTAKVVGNVVTGSKYHAIRSTGGALHMKDNLIINNANRGVYLGNKSAAGAIANNVIIGNGTGISGFSQSKLRIENNVIADSSYAGIGMRESCSLLIRDNIFKGNPRGLIVFKEGARGANSLRRNTFWRNETDTESLDKPADSITADPNFADPDSGDFSLTSGPALEHKQGLENPKIFKALWKRWKNRADKNEPFAEVNRPAES